MKSRKFNPWTLFTMFMIVNFALFFFFPFYWIMTGAFKLQNVAISMPPEWFPKSPTLANWVTLFNAPAWRWLFNSFFVSFCTMILVCITASMAGYVFAKKEFPGKKWLFWLFIAAMSLPKQVILIPLVNILADFQWIDTYQALIFPAIAWPFGIFLMKQFTQTLPSELLEAAKIDGASEWKIFTTIVLPLVKPGLGALAIFTFISSWNDYFSQLIFIRSKTMQTLPLGVALMQQEFTTNYGVLMAGAALASLPMIAIFIAFQRYFTEGITMGAVKG